MKIPAKVQNCVTHHEACPCREWKFKEAESALKVIRTWAGLLSTNPNDIFGSDYKKWMNQIANKAEEALQCLND